MWSRDGFLAADEEDAEREASPRRRRPPRTGRLHAHPGRRRLTPRGTAIGTRRTPRTRGRRPRFSLVHRGVRARRLAVGLLRGSAAVYDVHLLEDDLAPTLVGVIRARAPAVGEGARARSWMDSDSDSDEEGTSGTSPPEAEAEAEPEAEAPGAEAEAEA